MEDTLLELQSLSVRVGKRLVLAQIDLKVRPRSCMVVMGPGGAGKSTLLRTICGLNRGSALFQVEGVARYLGTSIIDDGAQGEEPSQAPSYPGLVEQKLSMMSTTAIELLSQAYADRETYTRDELRERIRQDLGELGVGELAEHFDAELLNLTLCERRLLMLVAAVIPDPALLCVDEPMARLSEEESQRILQFLASQKDKRAILLVSHHQRYTKQIGDETALLAGGRIQECADTASFFSAPQTQLAKDFVRTGSCTVASPESDPADLDPAYLASLATSGETAHIPSENRGPYGFYWMRPGRLAGTPMPGIVRSLQEDLDALERMQITLLVTLREGALEPEPYSARGIDLMHFPIVDMHPPELEPARAFCVRIQQRLAQGDIIAFHCRAGIGRTGTMLAAFEIYEGLGAEEAVARARQINPRWIQSEEQYQFLFKFEQWLESSVVRDGVPQN